jgi:hypothetical protein
MTNQNQNPGQKPGRQQQLRAVRGKNPIPVRTVSLDRRVNRGTSRRKEGLFLVRRPPGFAPVHVVGVFPLSALSAPHNGNHQFDRWIIKRLRGLRQPQYRLRVGEVRIFYDVTGSTVQVLAIVTKLEADSWLAQFGNPE